MWHRGPDDEGQWFSEDRRVALGSRRLSIIDLSPAGQMPIWNEDRTIGIIYNGECYNFTELRDFLVSRGHVFRSHTDTESILHLYEEMPSVEEMLGRIRGMFAIAIWDGPRRRLLLARDRLGIKPLYYARSAQGILFASEVRGLLASGRVATDLDPAGIQAYFAMGACPAPWTPLAAIRALPAGHYLLLEEGKEELRRYWNTDVSVDREVAEPAWLERIQVALLDSIRRHLVADVPVGIFASGGIDSSALVALARHVEHRRLRTYSVVFREAEFSEAEFARKLAQTYETDHHEFLVTSSEILQHMDASLDALDLPSWDGANVYLVSRITVQDGIKVALSGLGGDEIFFGYPSFRAVPRLRSLAGLTHVPGVGGLLRLAARNSDPGSRLPRVRDLQDAPLSTAAAYFAYRGLLDQQSLRELLRPEFAPPQPFDPVGYLSDLAPEPPDRLNAVSVLELKGWMHYQLLRDSDAMSMANSLELRVPFLDHPLVELLLRVPGALKRQRGPMNKHLLLRALPAPLPNELWDRPKRGFTLPYEVWLQGELRPLAEEMLLSACSPLAAVCRPEVLRRLWSGFQAGRVRWNRVWTATVLGRWLQGLDRVRARSPRMAEADRYAPLPRG
jgi:asparagine synthase (glutamine-hydrolysing)